jgi:hypothetical protein
MSVQNKILFLKGRRVDEHFSGKGVRLKKPTPFKRVSEAKLQKTWDTDL